jgi:Flp pilus assembly protein TadG
MRLKKALFARFATDTRGNFAAIASMVVSTLVLCSMGAVELAQVLNVRSSLQAAADSAALAAARQISFMGDSNGADELVQRVVEDVFFANSDEKITTGVATVTTAYTPEDGIVNVDVTLDAKAPPLVRYALQIEDLNVNAKARIAGSPNVCVIALDKQASRSVNNDATSFLLGRNCGIYADSSAANAVAVTDTSRINALFTCAHGGAEGPSANYSPAPITDCPRIGDPLADRPEPLNANDPCDHQKKKVTKVKTVLAPGVYCGGIKVNANGDVTMMPGIYVIRDGALEVDGQTALSGKGVTIYFKGAGAVLNFAGNADIDLEAPTDGEMAGILIFDSRSQNSGNTHKVTSNKTRRIVGAVYLPNTQLEVDAPQPVGSDSPWTAIIAREIRLLDDSQLVLNTNFDSTDVPAPAGIRGVEEPLRLIH